MQCMLKSNIFNLKAQGREHDPKEQVQDLGIDWIFDWHEIRGVRILIDHNYPK
jgi:hypothetical protein